MPDISSSSFLNQVQVPQTSNPAISTLATSSTSVGDKMQSLGKNDFLKLLLAELQNQDPSKPMDDSQTIAQMAQFSALEATQNLQQTIQQSNNIQAVNQAGALIGKYVQAQQSDGTTFDGLVSGVDFTSTDGAMQPTLVVNGADVDYSTIVKVSSTPITSATSAAASSAGSGTSSSGSGTSSSGSGGASSAGTSSTTTTSSAGTSTSGTTSTTGSAASSAATGTSATSGTTSTTPAATTSATSATGAAGT